jgi:hypothetical protein
MTPDQIRAINLSSNSVELMLFQEFTAQVAQLCLYFEAVSTSGMTVAIAANPLPVVIEPTPTAE